jgi:hypothetical protein
MTQNLQLGNLAPRITVNTSSNSVTVNTNLVIAKGIQANGSVGTAGQVLTSNGSSIYWATATTDPTPTVFLLMGA